MLNKKYIVTDMLTGDRTTYTKKLDIAKVLDVPPTLVGAATQYGRMIRKRWKVREVKDPTMEIHTKRTAVEDYDYGMLRKRMLQRLHEHHVEGIVAIDNKGEGQKATYDIWLKNAPEEVAREIRDMIV